MMDRLGQDAVWTELESPLKQAPRDVNQLAKLLTDVATGQAELPKTDDGKDPAAVSLGRRGGLKGGKARAEKLSAKRRAEIARAAAITRWRKS